LHSGGRNIEYLINNRNDEIFLEYPTLK